METIQQIILIMIIIISYTTFDYVKCDQIEINNKYNNLTVEDVSSQLNCLVSKSAFDCKTYFNDYYLPWKASIKLLCQNVYSLTIKFLNYDDKRPSNYFYIVKLNKNKIK